MRKIVACLFLVSTLVPVYDLLDWYSEFQNLPTDKAINHSPWQAIKTILAGWREFLAYFARPIFLTVLQWAIIGFVFWLLLSKMKETGFLDKILEKFFLLDGRRWCWFIFVFVLATSSIISYTVQRRLPNNPDSVAQLFQAKIFKMGRLYIDTPPFMEFFQEMYNLEKDGRLFSQFGPGYSFELMLGLFLGIPWIINPLNGAISVVLTYLIGRELFGEKTGKAASLIMACSPFFLLLNATFMNNPLSLLLFDVFLYFFILSFKRNDTKSPLIAGLSLGMIAFFRPLTVAALVVPFACYALFRLFKDFRGAGKPVLAMFVCFSSALLLRLAYNNFQYGGPFVTGYHVYDELYKGGKLVVFGFGKHTWGNIHTPFKGFLNIVKQLNRLNHTFLGWPVPGFLFMSLLFFLKKRLETWDIIMIVTFGSVLFFHFFHYWFMCRYLFCCFSLMAIMTVRGISQLVVWLKERGGMSQRVDCKLGLLMSGFILFGLTGKVLPSIIRPTGPRIQIIADTVEKANLNKPALVFVKAGQKNRWTYMRAFVHNSPTWDDRVLYPNDLGDDKNKELMSYYPDRLYFRFQQRKDRSGELIPLMP
jgi:4-amino-4-deoxy-L-arabinose transferase-like glycosyltransferase